MNDAAASRAVANKLLLAHLDNNPRAVKKALAELLKTDAMNTLGVVSYLLGVAADGLVHKYGRNIAWVTVSDALDAALTESVIAP
ncbi:MAG: hypothetical protein QOC62_3701 [Mycobacterium sp.]|jgi:hypothetical protein|nr:hypothetical protein [Mycobacterium sp.]